MTNADILTILKSDLDIAASSTTKDTLLNNLISLATAAIIREGITFADPLSVEDGTLIEMYAAFLYRKRKEATQTMPHSLRYMLNNKLLQQKGGANE